MQATMWHNSYSKHAERHIHMQGRCKHEHKYTSVIVCVCVRTQIHNAFTHEHPRILKVVKNRFAVVFSLSKGEKWSVRIREERGFNHEHLRGQRVLVESPFLFSSLLHSYASPSHASLHFPSLENFNSVFVSPHLDPRSLLPLLNFYLPPSLNFYTP